MANPPPGFGQEALIEARRPLDAYVDPTKRRIRIGIAPGAGAEMFVWMSAEIFQQSLDALMHSARQLGIPWPKEPSAQEPPATH